MIEDNLLGPKMRLLYGSVLITLGIITAVVTYRYVFPMGSIVSILSGLIFIFWNRFNDMIRNIGNSDNE
jgi:hypothetical protein